MAMNLCKQAYKERRGMSPPDDYVTKFWSDYVCQAETLYGIAHETDDT